MILQELNKLLTKLYAEDKKQDDSDYEPGLLRNIQSDPYLRERISNQHFTRQGLLPLA